MIKMERYKTKYLLTFFTIFFLVGSLYAETDKTDTITVDALLIKMREAIDPDNKLAEFKTRYSVAELNMPLQKIKAKIITKYKAPDKFFIETILDDGKFAIQAFNGKIAWKSDNSGNKVKLTGKEFDSFRFSSELEACKCRWGELFKTMVLGKNKYEVGKYHCYKLTCNPKEKYNIDTPVIFYVDDNEYLTRKMELTVFSIVGDILQTVYVEEYENIDSLLIPVKTKTDIFGAEMFLTVLKCKFNEDIKDEVFNFK